jgi:hypothetical protein
MKKLQPLPASGILGISDNVQTGVLTAATGAAFDVPEGSAYVNFAFTGDTFVRFGSTAAFVPSTNSSGATTAGTTTPQFMNPTARYIYGSTGYSVISPTTGYFTAEFWGP